MESPKKCLLVKNIKKLYQVRDTNNPVPGRDMADCPFIENAFLAAENGRIVGYGKMEDWEGITDWNQLEIIDASGKLVFPTFCDSHSHLIFAKTREEEFESRIKGLTYEEIAAKGGGILNSAKALGEMSEDQLYTEAFQRLKKLIQLGTGALEIKSGYGLTVESELKMLRVAKKLKETCPILIKITFLGAHAIPTKFKDTRQGYIDLIIHEMLPKIAAEGLADYVDVFCEKNYFTVEETTHIVVEAKKHGLKPKIHVNQFNALGGVKRCTELGAISVDHLEVCTEEDIKALAQSKTIPVSLPSCSFFLGLPYTPAREILNANLPLALASDYNPGSTPSGNLFFVFALACIQMKMMPNEALNALTINGAAAMELAEEMGTISLNKRANFVITREMNDLSYIPYSFGENHVDSVYINGKLQA